MKLRLLTPTRVVLESPAAAVVAEGQEGEFGLLPRHADLVSALVPGLLSYRREPGASPQYVAVDRGVLVKHGPEVLVSVRNAVTGLSLEDLVRTVHREFMEVDEQERVARSAVARLESDFIRRLMEFR